MTSFALQQALYQRLTGHAALVAALPAGVGGILDHVPQEAEYPLVTIGDTTESEWDTDDSIGVEAVVTVHTWSRAHRGRASVKAIMDIIKVALHRQTLTPTGHHGVMTMFQFAETFLDPDGITRHGVQQFRVIVEET